MLSVADVRVAMLRQLSSAVVTSAVFPVRNQSCPASIDGTTIATICTTSTGDRNSMHIFQRLRPTRSRSSDALILVALTQWLTVINI